MREAPQHSLGIVAAVALAGLTACTAAPRSTLLDGVDVTVRGHQELSLAPGRPPLPVVIGRDGSLGLCLEAPPVVDTSRWEAALTFASAAPAEDGFRPPDARAGATLCFDAPLPGDLADGDHALCATVRDGYDGRTERAPCAPFELRGEVVPYEALRSEIRSLLGDGGDPQETADAFDARGREAEARGFPLLALRMRLISAYLLRRAGTPSALQRAEAGLADTPDWLERPEASSWAAQLAYERATLALQAGWELERAWEQLRVAERSYRRIADPKAFTVAMKQSEILARVGAVKEGRDRLSAALAQCDRSPCDPRLLPAAENTLAWLILQDLDAGDDDLSRAEAILRGIANDGPAGADPLESANVWVNLAYVRTLRKEDPGASIAEAHELLARSAGSSSARAELLENWLRMVEARRAQNDRMPANAMELCREAAASSEDPRLSAWALSCVAELRREAGDLPGAAEAVERALLLHEYATSRALGQSIALGTCQRAEDYYRAARVAVERGDAGGAWNVLRELDGLAARDRSESRCADEARDRSERRSELVAQLAGLELPASATRRAQRQAIRQALRERLQELERVDAECAGPAESPGDATLDYRAVPLEDEVLLLRREPSGRVTLYRRTAFAREDLVRRTREIERMLAERTADERRWIETVAPLAAALVPDPADLGDVTSFALYGVLQRVPPAALPLPGPRTGRRWLADATVAVHRPAGAVARSAGRGATTGAPLFVVDPTGDLAGGAALERLYRSRFPDAHVLRGADATAGAFREALPEASWLHVDAHALYDPAFPELSSLRLADEPVSAADLRLATSSLWFANLSACRSGQWPVTADSGRYGLAGLLARRGVEWVVGARSDLSDTLARDFNAAFYDELAGGADVPGAYREALAMVRRAHPVSSWAALVLLGAEPVESGGRFTVARTPSKSGPPDVRAPGAGGVR